MFTDVASFAQMALQVCWTFKIFSYNKSNYFFVIVAMGTKDGHLK